MLDVIHPAYSTWLGGIKQATLATLPLSLPLVLVRSMQYPCFCGSGFCPVHTPLPAEGAFLTWAEPLPMGEGAVASDIDSEYNDFFGECPYYFSGSLLSRVAARIPDDSRSAIGNKF